MLKEIRAFFAGGNLRARAARGGLWLGAATAVDQGARFLRNVILARVLAPADFGMMATVAATASAFDAFMEVGVRQCVIQSKRGSEDSFLNAAWWFSAGRGAMLYAAGFLAAPLVSYIYRSEEFTPLLRMAFTVLLLQGLVSPRMHTLEKGLDFRRWVLVTQGAGVTSVVFAIGAAFWLRSVWALVLGIVLDAFLRMGLSQIVCGFRPRWPVDRQCFREISHFARGMFGLPILLMLFSQGAVLYLRRVYPDSEVGRYSMAANLSLAPQMILGGMVLPVMLPTFASLKEDPERLRLAVLYAVKSVILLAAPVTAFLVVFAEELIVIAYGPKYAGLGAVLSLLAAGALVMLVNGVVVSTFLALGVPALHRRYSFCRVIILAALIVPLVRAMGLEGAPLATLAALVTVFVVQQQRLDTLIGIPWREVMGAASEGLALGIVVLVCLMAVRMFVGGPSYVTLALGACIAAAALAVSGLLISAHGASEK